MSNEQLKHIFDDSVCLTRRQMKDYVEGTMTNEESYAVELHLNSCPFCSEATEGLFEQKEGRSVEMLAQLDTDFLKDHFSLQHPQIHLNSLTAAQPAAAHYPHKKRKTAQPLWRNVSIAAALALGLGIFWMMRYGRDNIAASNEIAGQAATPSLKPNTGQPLADNSPVSNAPSQSSPANNGSDPKSPQTLLLADETEDNQPKELTKAKEAPEPAADTAPQATGGEELAVNSYKVPLVEKSAAAMPRNTPAVEHIEKMPSRTADVAAVTSGVNNSSEDLKVSGARSAGSQTIVEGVQLSGKKTKSADDYLAEGDAFYNEKKYNQALREYRKELNSSDKGRRQKASLMTARCYLALGQKNEAKKALEDLVQNGSGGAKREAKRLLGEMEQE